jgi:hypothetical protein
MSLHMPYERPGGSRASSPFELRHASTHRPLLVVVPSRRLLAIHGAGSREAADFRLATTILRTVSEALRAKVLRVRRAEPVRPVLEVTWPIEPGLTVDEIVELMSGPTPLWRQMLELPPTATESMALEAIDQTRRREGRAFPLVRLIEVTEGPAVQILHLGSDDLLASIRKLYGFAAEPAFQTRDHLHELVIADAHAVGQARARSILRVPIAYR